MKKEYVSKNVIQRMPRYLRELNDLEREGVERISSSELGTRMGLTPSQIRQDFANFGGFGQQGYGYNVHTLKDEIGAILGVDRDRSMILVGTGKLGQCLLENFDFQHCGFTLKAAFDIKEDIVGETICGVPVLNAAVIRDYLRENPTDVAVLSTNRENVPIAAAALIESGIHAIWNFTECEISAGDSGVIIETIHFSDSLLRLGYYLNEED